MIYRELPSTSPVSVATLASLAPPRLVYVIGGSVVLFGKNRVLKLAVVNKIAVVSPAPLLIADRKFVVRWAGKWRECMKNKPNFRASELETLSLAKKHSSIIIQLTV